MMIARGEAKGSGSCSGETNKQNLGQAYDGCASTEEMAITLVMHRHEQQAIDQPVRNGCGRWQTWVDFWEDL
jgi:hypothetical protein